MCVCVCACVCVQPRVEVYCARESNVCDADYNGQANFELLVGLL